MLYLKSSNWTLLLSQYNLHSIRPLQIWTAQRLCAMLVRAVILPGVMWVSIEDDHVERRQCPYISPYHEGEQVSLIGKDKGGTHQANWMLCLCLHSPKTNNSTWISLKISTLMSKTDSWSSQPPTHVGMGLLPDTHNCRCTCAGNTRNVFLATDFKGNC